MTARADSLIETLQTPAVRDLAWACFSPSLIVSQAVAAAGMNIANCGLSLDEHRREWLERLDHMPRALLRHLESLRSRRLGLYFEALWHFLLEQDDRIELLGHNVPVRDGGRTIGEFDCLYYCHERQQHFHLELAVKFYLGLPRADDTGVHSHWNRWLGPGGHDRLDLKLEHLLQRQMLLGQHPRAKKVLQELGIGQMELEMEIKGRLFNRDDQLIPPPHGYNNALPLSRWTTVKEVDKNTQYAVLEKQHWLATVTPASGLCPLTPPLPAPSSPRLIATLDQRGYELERFFIVPEHWPEGE